MENRIYNRTRELIENYIDFIKVLHNTPIEANVSIDNLLKLKSVLSDVNNVMTLLTTRSVAEQLTKELQMNPDVREKVFQYIDGRKPNTNGFDIQISTTDEIQISAPAGILVEVKCNSLVHGKKLSADQINAILEDARKLRLEALRCKKVSQNIPDTKNYIKIVALVNFSSKPNEDLISQITRETICRETTNPARKERMKVKKFLKPLSSFSQIKEITELDNVYIIVLSKDDLKKELERIKSEYLH